MQHRVRARRVLGTVPSPAQPRALVEAGMAEALPAPPAMQAKPKIYESALHPTHAWHAGARSLAGAAFSDARPSTPSTTRRWRTTLDFRFVWARYALP